MSELDVLFLGVVYTPSIPALRKGQRQVDRCEFQISLVYKVSPRQGTKTIKKKYS